MVTLVLSCQDAVSLTAAGHQLGRWDWTENTVQRLLLQACSSLCWETKLHHDNVVSKLCDQKDQKIKGWSSATSTHHRRWPESLMVCIEQGKKKKDWLCTGPDVSSNSASILWEVCDLKTYLILFPYLGLSHYPLFWVILRIKRLMYISGKSIYNIFRA